MTVRGKPGKPKAGFPPFPPPLEIAARFPHSHSRAEPWKSGKPTPGFPLSHGSTVLFLKAQSEGMPVGGASPRLQADSLNWKVPGPDQSLEQRQLPLR